MEEIMNKNSIKVLFVLISATLGLFGEKSIFAATLAPEQEVQSKIASEETGLVRIKLPTERPKTDIRSLLGGAYRKRHERRAREQRIREEAAKKRQQEIEEEQRAALEQLKRDLKTEYDKIKSASDLKALAAPILNINMKASDNRDVLIEMFPLAETTDYLVGNFCRVVGLLPAPSSPEEKEAFKARVEFFANAFNPFLASLGETILVTVPQFIYLKHLIDTIGFLQKENTTGIVLPKIMNDTFDKIYRRFFYTGNTVFRGLLFELCD